MANEIAGDASGLHVRRFERKERQHLIGFARYRQELARGTQVAGGG